MWVKENNMFGDLVKVSESFTISMCYNGYVLEVSGRDEEGDWKTLKIIVVDIENLIETIKELDKMEKDN
jgi:hypothetical protein